jgi:maleylacetate reductase
MTIPARPLVSGIFTIQAQERVVFGKPAGQAVIGELERYGLQRAFVVSTRSLRAQVDGPLQSVELALGARHAGSFDRIGAHSPREDVLAAAAAARAVRADVLVAVGGGSVIDATKAMQMVLWMDLQSVADLEPYRQGASAEIAKPILAPVDPIRCIAVSTTLSAAEFTSQAGVTDTQLNAKQSFAHRCFAPRSVILDPAATLQTPPWLLFCTGIRAVDHAVESYCATLANPATEATSLQGLRLLATALPQIKAAPDALEPRLQAQFGMWQAIAACAAGIPTGASHGIGYVLGASYGVAHGHTSCVMLPAVLRWNAAVNAQRQQALSEAMGSAHRPAWELVADLVQRLEQPGTLREVNIQRTDFDVIARRALTYGPVRANPRPVKGEADVKEILELAW